MCFRFSKQCEKETKLTPPACFNVVVSGNGCSVKTPTWTLANQQFVSHQVVKQNAGPCCFKATLLRGLDTSNYVLRAVPAIPIRISRPMSQLKNPGPWSHPRAVTIQFLPFTVTGLSPSPRGPGFPCGPAGPCGPSGPTSPGGPRAAAPGGPVGPWGPAGPRAPLGPMGPGFLSDTRSRSTRVASDRSGAIEAPRP